MVIGSFLFFTALVAGLTWWLTHKDDHATSAGYFLGGRSLGGVVIAGSLLLTNLSTEQMVGLNGAAFADGLSVMAWEVVAVIALVAMALFFLPRYLRSGITTVPQFLEQRFNATTQLLTTLIFLVAYAVILLPIILYTGARGLSEMADLYAITGIESELGVIVLTVVLVGVIGSVYALFGGLRTVAVSDTLNGVGLLVGGLMIVWFALTKVGGDGGVIQGIQTVYEADPQRFNSIGGPEQSVPLGTLFTGVLLLNLFYWTTNQQIIQRTFGARSLREGQKGVLLCGGLKLLGPLYLVIPGMIAYHLYHQDPTVSADQAYGRLVRDVLPAPLTGFFIAVMVGAILSSFNSALNSACTLFSLGLYKGALRPEASEHEVVRSGKVFGWLTAAAAMAVAPLLMNQPSIFAYLQKMNGLYFIPIFAVLLVGLLARRVPAGAANTALVVGLVVIAFGYFVPLGRDADDVLLFAAGGLVHDFHFLGIVFAGLVALMLGWGAVRPMPEAWEQPHSGDVAITPWAAAVPVGVALLAAVAAIYVLLADLSVLTR